MLSKGTDLLSAAKASWFLRPKPRAHARIRLFCLPYAGGGAQVFRPWAELLPPEVELVAVELPGRGQRLREPPLRSVEAVVEPLVQALLATDFLAQPYALFGHSMGGLLSFALTRALVERGSPLPQRLFISGRQAPHRAAKSQERHRMSDADLLESLRTLGGTPQEVLAHRELMELMLPMLRADFQVCETYVYSEGPKLPCPLTIFSGSGDVYLDKDDLEGWAQHTDKASSVRLFPGDHFYLHPQRVELLTALSRELLESPGA